MGDIEREQLSSCERSRGVGMGKDWAAGWMLVLAEIVWIL
jgi:hypothetical protein